MLVAIIGLGWGSFSTMATYRIPRGMPWIGARPHCNKCKTPLKFIDYCSLISYFSRKGKCRYCGAEYETSISDFCTEFFITALIILAYLQYGLGDMFVIVAHMSVATVILAVVDAEHKQIPVKILISFLLIAVIYRIYVDQHFYGVLFGGGIGLIVGLCARTLYFLSQKRPDIANDYAKYQDNDRFSGLGFDYVKLLGIVGVWLSVSHFIIFSIVLIFTALLWWLFHKKTLRLGTLMVSLLTLMVIYQEPIQQFLQRLLAHLS